MQLAALRNVALENIYLSEAERSDDNGEGKSPILLTDS